MRGRTDIHRPVSFDPEAYEFSHAGTFSSEDFLAEVRKDAARMMKIRRDEGWTMAPHQHAGQCGHCGARLVHYAVMLHLPSREMIEVGETCLDNRFEMATATFQSWRKARAGKRAADAKAEKIANTLAAHPMLEQLGKWAEKSDFIRDIAAKFMHYGEMSERQIAAVEKAMQREIDREAQKAEEAEAMSTVPAMTAGRRLISGTIISKKYVQNDYSYYGGTTAKIVIRDAEGYRYYGTLPSAVCDLEKGAHLQIVATIKPSNDDKHFGFFSRPTLKG